MTDSELLRKIIKKSGYKMYKIAEELGISPYSLQKKIDNVVDFKVTEVRTLAEFLGLNKDQVNSIFFCKNA